MSTFEKAPIVPGDPIVLESDVPSVAAADRWWASADYVVGWIKSTAVPPLVTSSPAGTAQAAAGVLQQPGTIFVFGAQNTGGDVRSGLRFDVGGWFNDDRTVGMDVGFTVLESLDSLFAASSTGNPILARPFKDVTSGNQTSALIAFPGFASGSVNAFVRTDNFYDFHLDFDGVILETGGFRLESLLGYRFLRFNDAMGVDQTVVSAGSGLVAAGTTVQTSDRFTAGNYFNGIDFGLVADYTGERWSVGAVAKMAVGSLKRSVGIAGMTHIAVPGQAPVDLPGGMLALSSNSGVFTSRDWVIAPETGIQFGWEVTPHVLLRLGYSIVYLTDVARAAEQANLNLNPNLFPPAPANGALPNSPTFQLHKSDLFVQTVNFGVEFRF
jgi:hypothetical protein